MDTRGRGEPRLLTRGGTRIAWRQGAGTPCPPCTPWCWSDYAPTRFALTRECREIYPRCTRAVRSASIRNGSRRLRSVDMVDAWPLVDRESELARALSAVAGGGAVVFGGIQGVG